MQITQHISAQSSRLTVNKQHNSIDIEIRAQHNTLFVAFLCLFLFGISIWQASVPIIAMTGLELKHYSPSVIPILAHCAFWSAATLGALHGILWQLIGKEVISKQHGVLVHRRQLGALAFARQYDTAHISCVREAQYSNMLERILALFGLSGTVAFDYGAQTQRLGAGLSQAETQRLLSMLQ